MLGQDLLSLLRRGGGGPPFLGLDIGNYSVKALKFGRTKAGLEVEDLAEMEIPLEIRQEGRAPEVMAEVINTCLAEGNIVSKDAVIMVSGPQVFIRRVTLPPIPQEELEAALPFEAAKYVPFPIEQAALDYVIMGEKEEEGVKKLDILLVATPREAVEQELSIARAAGLRPVALSVAPMALWNAFQLSEIEAEEKMVALLDIGYKRTTISFFNKGVLEFTRTINLGGNDITESLRIVSLIETEDGKRTLTYEEAEAIKLEHGFPPSTEAGTTEEGIALTQISMLMRPTLEKLLSEIRMSFDFYVTEFQVLKVDRAIISGGGAALKGLKDFLSGELGMEVELANPFQGVDFTGGVSEEDVKAVAPAFAVVLGLAAWETHDLSLLPRKKAKKEVSPTTAFVALGGVVAIVVFYIYWSASGEMANARAELDKRVSELATLGTASARALQLSAKKRSLQTEIDSFPQVLRESIDCAKVLIELRHSIPDNMRLEEVNVAPQTPMGGKKMLKIWGTAFSMDEKGPSVSNLMVALENSSLFDDVRLLYLEENKKYTVEGSKFQLSCQCKPGGS